MMMPNMFDEPQPRRFMRARECIGIHAAACIFKAQFIRIMCASEAKKGAVRPSGSEANARFLYRK